MASEKVALTGANGFLGFHVQSALREKGIGAAVIPLGVAYDSARSVTAMAGVDRLVHLAGVNRGSDDQVADGNVLFAHQLAEAIRHCPSPPRTIVFANSTQSTNESVYGLAKSTSAKILRAAAESAGAEFQDILLPNLFGEHGRPFYNAVTATFCHLLARGEQPLIKNDAQLTLLHAQDAADKLLGYTPVEVSVRETSDLTVRDLLSRLQQISQVYAQGEIPDVSSDFTRNLFNTYRSYTFPTVGPIRLTKHADARGSFFEIVRSHGGTNQFSFSTTAPGISRGDHFHRRKIERFTVLSGTATIALRRILSDDIVEFQVSGDEPVAVDIPTMWAHKITNTGSGALYTSFWCNDIFDSKAPDTISEKVYA
ncbi:SDR family oxidoreductase [Cryobacterium sp. TMS1-20-1]|uniref:polysaccharide biosynthesis C-terminal domain-containing protein n=1 Tax=Cryobacterium sp. TMS1-20-1 TaxID=1259223 RepID=UPI001068ED72|nr:NAD-dependent epimerase/dehydratase family protein [Cryobacterium sp. TMS1-20-1]TFC70742.1 SDR family oxidoreductase [Cryobacterium sp. TMS1-20-1]